MRTRPTGLRARPRAASERPNTRTPRFLLRLRLREEADSMTQLRLQADRERKAGRWHAAIERYERYLRLSVVPRSGRVH